MSPAIFLDRDGVVNEEVGYISDISSLKIFPYVRDCVNRLHELGFIVIVISNQSGIARGLIEENDLIHINNHIKDVTGIDEVYYCPHYPEGKNKIYTRECNCRKPKIGMVEKAVKEFNIDLFSSYFVGDRAVDIETGKNAGIKTILVESGYGTKGMEYTVEPDIVCEDLREVVNVLCKGPISGGKGM